MNNQEQPLPALENTETQTTEQQESGEKKPPPGKLMAKLSEVTGNEKKAKLIIGLFGFTVFSILLLIFASLFRRPPSGPVIPELPTPTPVRTTPTPVPQLEKGDINLLIEDIDAFDTNQKDLTPPQVDLKISL